MDEGAPFDAEGVRRFVDRLHARPSQHDAPAPVDWSDAPWPYKVYAVPASARVDEANVSPGRLAETLRWLVAAAGITRIGCAGTGVRVRRAVASGGAMYPTELYPVVGSGAYHFDPARHGLVPLGGSGDAGGRLAAAAGQPHPVDGVVLTHRFWKNGYKYRDFGYRLGAVDAGVVLGRLLRLGGPNWPRPRLAVDFDDAAVHRLLGLDDRDEAAYAVLLLGPASIARPLPVPRPAVPPPVRDRSARIRRSAGVRAMQRAAAAPARVGGGPGRLDVPLPAGDAVPLPPPLALPGGPAPLRPRRSAAASFTGRPARAAELATILSDCWRELSRVRRCAEPLPALRLHCAVCHVAGVPAGWFGYDGEGNRLLAADTDEHPGRDLQDALYTPVANLRLAAFVVHVTGRLGPHGPRSAAREYRVQQLLVGVAVDALTAASTLLGLGSHPFLGFDAAAVDRRYRLGPGTSTLAQVCVGHLRGGAVIEGAVW